MTSQPGVLAPPPELRALGRVSPSHFTGMLACALRETWAASRAPGLLPGAPAGRLGTVVHRLLEEAGRGQLAGLDQDAIDHRWEDLLRGEEAVAAASWLDRHLLPLRSAIPDFEVRRLRALSAARALAAEASAMQHGDGTPRWPFGYELPVATTDGQAGGRIDSVRPGPDGPVLRDYKSGAIYEGTTGHPRAVKGAYAAQLRLYAAIYASMTGVWPSRLEVVPLAGSAEEVEFTREQCMQLLSDAIDLRGRINDIINSDAPLAARMSRLAAPAEPICSFCAYRPHCGPYLERERFEQGGWPLDVNGTLTEKRILGNGRMMLALESDGTSIQVRGLTVDADRHPAIPAASVGDRVVAFNLRAGGSPSAFTEGPFTVFYRVPRERWEPATSVSAS